MRQDRVCPKCEGRTFYTVKKARMGDGRSLNGTVELALAAEFIKTGETGFLGEKYARIEAHVDAWICASCGFTELYARDVGPLAQLLEEGASGVAFVDARPAPKGAFR